MTSVTILHNSKHNQTAVRDEHEKLKNLLVKLEVVTREQSAREQENFDQISFILSEMVQYFQAFGSEYDVSDNSMEESQLLATATIAAAGKRTTVPKFLKIRWV